MTSGFLGANNFTFFSNGGPTIPSDVITGTLSPTYMPYASGAHVLSDSGIYWDAVNARVGIGTITPSTTLEVAGDLGILQCINGAATTNAYLAFALAGTNKWSIGNVYGSGSGTTGNYFTIYDEVNTASRLSITNGGNVGIGTTAPSARLDVHGTGIISIVNGTTTNDAFMGFANAGTNKWKIGNTYGTGTGTAGNYFTIYDVVNSASRITVLNDGKVGIGTTSPSVLFHINSAATPAFRLVDTTQGAGKYLTSDANGNASWAAITIPTVSGTANYVAKFTASTTVGNSIIQDDGTNVGIGVAPSTYKFRVQGTGYFNSALTANNGFSMVSGTANFGGNYVYLDSTTYCYIRASNGGGELVLAATGTIRMYPDTTTAPTSQVYTTIVSNGSGGWEALWQAGALRSNGDVIAGYAPYGGSYGGGGLITVDPATGSANVNSWKFGNLITAAVTPDTTRYVDIKIGSNRYKFIIST